MDRRIAQVGALILSVAVVLATPLMTESLYILNIFIMAGIAVMLAVTNHLIIRTGVWFMGHIAFLAIGSFAVILSRQFLNLNYWVTVPLAGISAALVALGLGYATAKVKGMSFCILSVAFVEVVRLTAKRAYGGRAIICDAPDPLFGIDFSSRVHYYYFMCILLALVLILVRMIYSSHVGSTLKAIAKSETLAESLGIDTVRYRVMIMVFCCGMAGVVGSFFAPYIQVIGDTSFGFMPTIVIIMGIAVGGHQSFWGPIVGAAFLSVLPEFIPGHRATIEYIIYAVIVLVTLFFLPRGLISLPRVIKRLIVSLG